MAVRISNEISGRAIRKMFREAFPGGCIRYSSVIPRNCKISICWFTTTLGGVYRESNNLSVTDAKSEKSVSAFPVRFRNPDIRFAGSTAGFLTFETRVSGIIILLPF